MASEKDLELLDQYVSNRLSAQERAAFENKLASDNTLKQEFQIQQKVVGKIREARVQELKTMFNSIPASSFETGGSSVLTQVALWVAVVGVVGAGLYFLLNKNEASQNVSTEEQITADAPQASTPAQDEPAKEESPTVVDDEKPSQKAVTPPAEKQEDTEFQSSDGLNADEEAKGPAPLDVFDPSEENKESAERKSPAGVSESTPLTKSSIAVETDSNNKRYNFHYQFKNGKLFLYGTFEKNLYEIMEFFSDNKRTVFLFYKDNYYLLNEENEAVKPLAPINDPTLLKKLKDYRGTR